MQSKKLKESSGTKIEYKHVKGELEKMFNKVKNNEMTDSDSEKMTTIFKLLSMTNIKKSKESYLVSLIDWMIDIRGTAVGNLYRQEIYSFFYLFMRKEVKLDVANKLRAYKHMRYLNDLDVIFSDLYSDYNDLERMDVNGKVFRNYILEKIIEKSFTVKDSTRILNGICEAMDKYKNVFAKCLCDIETLPDEKENTENKPEKFKDEYKVVFMLYYTYKWLENVQIDLNALKSAKEVEEIEDSVISRVFDAFNSLPEIEFGVFKEKEVIYKLFNTNNYENILFSVYQRLFNFYIWKNKKKLANSKILRAFDRNQQHNIYLKLRNTHESFVNVFKQINPQYLILELEKTRSHHILKDVFMHFDLFTAQKDIATIFNTMFFAFESSFNTSQISNLSTAISKHLEIFADSFAELHEYSKHEIRNKLNQIDLNINIAEYKKNVSVLHMLTYFNEPRFDMVELVGLILDDEGIIRSKEEYFRCKYILCLIYKFKELIGIGLINRLKVVIKKNIGNREHIKMLGRIYNYIFENKEENRFNPLILGAIGSNKFKINTGGESNLEYVAVLLNMHYSVTNEHLDVCSSILNSTDNQILKMLVFETVIDLINSESNLKLINKFITNNSTLLVDLFMKHHEQIGVILIYGLRNKLVVPQSVIKYLISKFNNQYIMRNYYETCLNSANDAIEIVYCDLIDEIVEATSTDGMDKKTLERIVSKKTSNLILSNLYSFENKNEYIFRKKRELVIKEETLFVYLLLKNIKEYSKADKEQFMTELEQRTEKEEIREILEKIRKNYSRGGRKEIEIDVLL